MVNSLDIAVCVLTLLLLRWVYNRRARGNAQNLPHPPGPPGLPLIGNLRDLPTHPAWLKYEQWSREYGASRLWVFFGRTER